MELIIPERLYPGDKIAIVSPATTVKEEYVAGATRMLREEGFTVEVMPSALGPADGSYASSLHNRLSDLRNALNDSSVKCILCARGGYGCVHLLPEITTEEIRRNPKWLIGFSDISALHALWHKAGVASLHAPMAKHLSTGEPTNHPTSHLLKILRGEEMMNYELSSSRFNRTGEARGILRGGNLAVLNGLASTPFDILRVGSDENVILFIEDISEAIYAVERMLLRLNLSGDLKRLKGFIIGQFTEYRPDRNFNSMEEMIDALLTKYGISDIPVAFEFPIGHVDYNLPLIEGGSVEFSVTEKTVKLKSV